MRLLFDRGRWQVALPFLPWGHSMMRLVQVPYQAAAHLYQLVREFVASSHGELHGTSELGE